jgi:hypothetical protein
MGMFAKRFTVAFACIAIWCDVVIAQKITPGEAAAGALIIQQGRTRQELQETKRELKAIREGLGIDEPSTQRDGPDPTALPVAILCAVGVAIGLLVFFASIVSNARKEAAKLKAERPERILQLHEAVKHGKSEDAYRHLLWLNRWLFPYGLYALVLIKWYDLPQLYTSFQANRFKNFATAEAIENEAFLRIAVTIGLCILYVVLWRLFWFLRAKLLVQSAAIALPTTEDRPSQTLTSSATPAPSRWPARKK